MQCGCVHMLHHSGRVQFFLCMVVNAKCTLVDVTAAYGIVFNVLLIGVLHAVFFCILRNFYV
jgi:hypothetical protein